MKGFFFERPLEYHLETDGEEWEQGGRLQGTLRVKNIDKDPIGSERFQIVLAYGVYKKIKDKDTDAWTEVETQILAENIKLSPQEEQSYNWEFDLPTDCQITDKGGSLFLRYGSGNSASQGKIDVRVNLLPILQSFLQTFETQFRFKKNYEKSKNEYTEIKLVPPDSQDFPSLDHVLCLMRIHEDKMEIRYLFKMKSLGRGDSENMKVMRKKKEYQQEFTAEQYTTGGFPNREFFRQAIQEAVDQAKPRVIF
ncbi:MAG: hypothetical protein HQM14_05140 [SAR324 cluster bacterium]|nr:hypothetical protein [SAR324 cluster bacterium]